MSGVLKSGSYDINQKFQTYFSFFSDIILILDWFYYLLLFIGTQVE